MLHLLKDFWRGFVGGPDFNRCITHRFILGDKQLTLKLPDSNVAAVPNKIDVSFPHTSTSWFEQNAKIYEQHKFVRIVTENWMYVPVISIISGDEFGMLSCQLRIKQTDKINVLDKQALANFLIQEYEDYHNRPEGKNVELRKTTKERFAKSSVSWTYEEIEEEIVGYIEAYGNPPIPDGIIKSFNQTDWVFYQEIRSNSLSRHDFYCLPLSETSFLEVKFNHSVDRSDKHKKWSKHALASQERIMESITLSDIPDEQDNLLVDNSVKNS
ncbi:hypothetical protein ACM9HF_06455 [Colwellia sp. RE-S-Sl-9]